jgi:hypothetical protein
LQVGILMLDWVTEGGCRSDRLVHQRLAACFEHPVGEYLVNREAAFRDSQPVKGNIPDEFASTFGCQIIYQPRVDTALAECLDEHACPGEGGPAYLPIEIIP